MHFRWNNNSNIFYIEYYQNNLEIFYQLNVHQINLERFLVDFRIVVYCTHNEIPYVIYKLNTIVIPLDNFKNNFIYFIIMISIQNYII